MRNLIGLTAFAPFLALALAACSSDTPDDAGTSPDAGVAATDGAGGADTLDQTLTLNGLGRLKIGEPVPAESSFDLRGAQASETCLVYTSPRRDGVYAIVEDGAVRRITVGSGSGVRLVEGVGVGSTRADVDAKFPGFLESPAKYVEGGSDLIAPGADSGEVAVRFELDADGTVTAMHVGTMPVLGYVEGCG